MCCYVLSSTLAELMFLPFCAICIDSMYIAAVGIAHVLLCRHTSVSADVAQGEKDSLAEDIYSLPDDADQHTPDMKIGTAVKLGGYSGCVIKEVLDMDKFIIAVPGVGDMEARSGEFEVTASVTSVSSLFPLESIHHIHDMASDSGRGYSSPKREIDAKYRNLLNIDKSHPGLLIPLTLSLFGALACCFRFCTSQPQEGPVSVSDDQKVSRVVNSI